MLGAQPLAPAEKGPTRTKQVQELQVQEQTNSSLSIPSHSGDLAARLLGAVEHFLGLGSRFVTAVERIASSAERLAEVHAPPPADKVDSTYVAERLGVTNTWVAANARDGKIPPRCIVPGTGNGTPWKFYRERIDEWLQHR